jgi:hypothetical protein
MCVFLIKSRVVGAVFTARIHQEIAGSYRVRKGMPGDQRSPLQNAPVNGRPKVSPTI